MAAMEEARAALSRARQENSKRERVEWDMWRKEHGDKHNQTPGPRFFDEKAFEQLSSFKSIPSIHFPTGKFMRENDMIEEKARQTTGPGAYNPPTSVGSGLAVHFSSAPLKRLNDLIEEQARATPGVGDYDTTRLDSRHLGSGRISSSSELRLLDKVYKTFKGSPGPLTYAPVISAVPTISASKIKESLLSGTRPSTAGMPSLMPSLPGASRGRPISASALRAFKGTEGGGGGGMTGAQFFERSTIEENKGIGTGMSFATANIRSMLFAQPSAAEEGGDDAEAGGEGAEGGAGGRSPSPSKGIVSSDGRHMDGSLAPGRLLSRLDRAEKELQAAAESVLSGLPEDKREAFLEWQQKRLLLASSSSSSSSPGGSPSTSPTRRAGARSPRSAAEAAQMREAMKGAEALVAAEEAAARGDVAAAEAAAREAEAAAQAAVALAASAAAEEGGGGGGGEGEAGATAAEPSVVAATALEIAKRARRASVSARDAASTALAAAAAAGGDGGAAGASEAPAAAPPVPAPVVEAAPIAGGDGGGVNGAA
jgi:hypothetical protein